MPGRCQRDRAERHTWRQCLRTHWQTLAAADFFTVEVWTPFGLVRYVVFFVMDMPTRKAEIAGIAPEPNLNRVQPLGQDANGMDAFRKGQIMSRKRHRPEEIIAKLREAEVALVKVAPAPGRRGSRGSTGRASATRGSPSRHTEQHPA